MLHGREPTRLHGGREGGLFGLFDFEATIDVLATQLFRPPDGWAAEGITLDAEHRTFGGWIAAHDARIGAARPRLGGLVVDRILEADREAAAAEDEGLGDGDTRAVAPGQRHAQFLLAGRERVLARGAREDIQVARRPLILLASGQTGLQQVVSRG